MHVLYMRLLGHVTPHTIRIGNDEKLLGFERILVDLDFEFFERFLTVILFFIG